VISRRDTVQARANRPHQPSSSLGRTLTARIAPVGPSGRDLHPYRSLETTPARLAFMASGGRRQLAFRPSQVRSEGCLISRAARPRRSLPASVSHGAVGDWGILAGKPTGYCLDGRRPCRAVGGHPPVPGFDSAEACPKTTYPVGWHPRRGWTDENPLARHLLGSRRRAKITQTPQILC